MTDEPNLTIDLSDEDRARLVDPAYRLELNRETGTARVVRADGANPAGDDADRRNG